MELIVEFLAAAGKNHLLARRSLNDQPKRGGLVAKPTPDLYKDENSDLAHPKEINALFTKS
ncbi:MAG TPA: hypothetical protein VFS21_12120 [Roseiflexaceae bacterium]|nr:hypothetical protein [Roseiflexaceae bacterium]